MATTTQLKMGRIPIEIVVPILRAYLDSYETYASDIQSRWHEVDPNELAPSPVRILADEAGMKKDTLDKLLCQRIQTISPECLDLLLCAMDLVHLWFQEPLLPYYERWAS